MLAIQLSSYPAIQLSSYPAIQLSSYHGKGLNSWKVKRDGLQAAIANVESQLQSLLTGWSDQ